MVGAFVHRAVTFGAPAALLLTLVSCSSSESSSHDCAPGADAIQNDLACAGLYSDFDARIVVSTARPFAPAATLFTDGLEKSRWIDLPAGTKIDATAPDDWQFPVGTKVWKEFRARDRKVETRLLWKKAEGWVVTSYVWSEDGKQAKRGEGTNLTVEGLPYHVPTQTECMDCHKGRRDIVLGFEAVSLALPAATGATLASLVQENLVAPAPAKTSLTVDPGAAYLHVNCGVSCHNDTSAASRKDSRLRLRIALDEASNKPLTAWQLYATTVNVKASLPAWRSGPLLAPGQPERSVIVSAMTSGDSNDKMPPLRRDIDVEGLAAVSAFIKSVPPR
ncbi:MAG: hypothetical protein JST00_25925 [Deltaproteobacteria bacterium]|nr:hypothetical protein [Deltaproteobacteria bacterium]